MHFVGHSMGLTERWDKVRYGSLLAVLPAVWPLIILGLFSKDYIGCEKFSL